MKKIKSKFMLLKAFIFMFTSAVCMNVITANAATPKFNQSEAEQTAKDWLNPLADFALWAIPACGLARTLWAFVGWLQKDEQEREQNPFHRTLLTYVKWTIGIELLPVIFKIFGLADKL